MIEVLNWTIEHPAMTTWLLSYIGLILVGIAHGLGPKEPRP